MDIDAVKSDVGRLLVAVEKVAESYRKAEESIATDYGWNLGPRDVDLVGWALAESDDPEAQEAFVRLKAWVGASS